MRNVFVVILSLKLLCLKEGLIRQNLQMIGSDDLIKKEQMLLLIELFVELEKWLFLQLGFSVCEQYVLVFE